MKVVIKVVQLVKASLKQIVQVVKSRSGQKLKEVSRSLYIGFQNRPLDLIGMSQITSFQINTAYIVREELLFELGCQLCSVVPVVWHVQSRELKAKCFGRVRFIIFVRFILVWGQRKPRLA